MKGIDKRIIELEELLKQAKAKKQKIEAQQKALANKKKRNEETRRKVLVGATVLAKVKSGEWPQDRFMAMMNAALSRPHDRALFDLPERQPELSTKLPAKMPTN